MKYLIFAILLSLMTPSAKAAQCDTVALTITTPSYSLNSNPNPVLSFTVKVTEKTGKNDCIYFVTFNQGSAPDYNRKLYNGLASVPIQLYNTPPSTYVLQDYPTLVSANNAIVGTLKSTSNGGKTNTHTYATTFSIPPANTLWGTYQNTFAVKLYTGTVTGSHTLVSTKTVTYTYTIAKVINLALVTEGAPFDVFATTYNMDFGNMSTGQTKGFDAVIVSNAGYQLSFSSQNNGRLKHSTRNSYVNYSVTVNTTPYSLVGSSTLPVIVATGTGATSSQGARANTKVILGTVATQLAGIYMDTVTISVATTN